MVARVEVIDQLSGGKLTTEYRYHHGYWDGAEREFRGFGLVEQLDTETFADYHTAGAPPIAVRRSRGIRLAAHRDPTWFHQGPVGDEPGDWDELDLSSEYWPGDPTAARPAEHDQPLSSPPARDGRARDALRALRGRVLRTELYALDGTAARRTARTPSPSSLYGLRRGIRTRRRASRTAGGSSSRTPRPAHHAVGARRRPDDPARVHRRLRPPTASHARSATSRVPRGARLPAPRSEPVQPTRRPTWRTQPDRLRPPRRRLTTTSSTGSPARPPTKSSTTAGDRCSALQAALRGDSRQRDPVDRPDLQYYDGAAFRGCPPGSSATTARWSAPNLVLTEAILHEAYRSDRRPRPARDAALPDGRWHARLDRRTTRAEFRRLCRRWPATLTARRRRVHGRGYFAATERRQLRLPATAGGTAPRAGHRHPRPARPRDRHRP